jgi:hypothetical protein
MNALDQIRLSFYWRAIIRTIQPGKKISELQDAQNLEKGRT